MVLCSEYFEKVNASVINTYNVFAFNAGVYSEQIVSSISSEMSQAISGYRPLLSSRSDNIHNIIRLSIPVRFMEAFQFFQLLTA